MPRWLLGHLTLPERPMLYDFAISAIVTLIVISPMAFAAWYDSRLETQPEIHVED